MSVATAVLADLADQLPSDPVELRRVLELGLHEVRIQKALDAVRRGEISLAAAAERVGVSRRQMIPIAFAHGLEPYVDPELLEQDRLDLEQAAGL